MYPCNCCVGDCTITVNGCPDSADCLQVASIIVPPATSITGCGGEGSVDVGAESTLTACTTSITWSLISWDTTAFTDVAIDSDGVLTFTSTNAAVADTYYKFIGKVHCSGSLLSQYFTVTVPIKNLCYGVTCAESLSCNPCTGGCITPPDVEIS